MYKIRTSEDENIRLLYWAPMLHTTSKRKPNVFGFRQKNYLKNLNFKYLVKYTKIY